MFYRILFDNTFVHLDFASDDEAREAAKFLTGQDDVSQTCFRMTPEDMRYHNDIDPTLSLLKAMTEFRSNLLAAKRDWSSMQNHYERLKTKVETSERHKGGTDGAGRAHMRQCMRRAEMAAERFERAEARFNRCSEYFIAMQSGQKPETVISKEPSVLVPA